MRIETVRLKNFKTFENVELIDIPAFCIVVGANGTGKSTMEEDKDEQIPENIQPRFVVFEGKQDLERQLVRKLRLWRIPDCRFFVLRDQDSGDCRLIKRNLLEK